MADTPEDANENAPDSLTTYPPVDLAKWLVERARRNKRSVSKELELILEQEREREHRRAS